MGVRGGPDTSSGSGVAGRARRARTLRSPGGPWTRKVYARGVRPRLRAANKAVKCASRLRLLSGARVGRYHHPVEAAAGPNRSRNPLTGPQPGEEPEPSWALPSNSGRRARRQENWARPPRPTPLAVLCLSPPRGRCQSPAPPGLSLRPARPDVTSCGGDGGGGGDGDGCVSVRSAVHVRSGQLVRGAVETTRGARAGVRTSGGTGRGREELRGAVAAFRPASRDVWARRGFCSPVRPRGPPLPRVLWPCQAGHFAPTPRFFSHTDSSHPHLLTPVLSPDKPCFRPLWCLAYPVWAARRALTPRRRSAHSWLSWHALTLTQALAEISVDWLSRVRLPFPPFPRSSWDGPASVSLLPSCPPDRPWMAPSSSTA